jgi:DNA repair exonuclease SbcCD ATPase subunit
MKMYLQHLSIAGFRGIGSSLDIPLAHRTILYGPNGSGKTSILQAIAWALYGKLPAFSGGVFSKEDALVNDFLDTEKADVTLTLSENRTITRQRSKQDSTTKGAKPPSLSFQAQDPQDAIEKLLGLSNEEFFTAVFLHQETIRDFLTTTPEKRSATIDRMIGTSLLRALVKQVDPRVPNKALEAVQKQIELIGTTLSQASVLNREMIEKKKAQYGNPENLPAVLADALQKITPILTELGISAPPAQLEQLKSTLSIARQKQLEQVSGLTRRAGELRNMKERYLNASDVNWQNVRQQREQYGDPAELPDLLHGIHGLLDPISLKLTISQPGESLAELVAGLDEARQVQPLSVRKLSQRIAALEALKSRYIQAAVTDWQEFNKRKASFGDPSTLPTLLKEVQQSLNPILQMLDLPKPKDDLPSLEASLAKSRQILPGITSKLERQAGELLALKASYLQAAAEVVDETTIPEELTTQLKTSKKNLASLNKEFQDLTRQAESLQGKEEQVKSLRSQIQILPGLRGDMQRLGEDLARLAAASKQGKLYNQVLDASRQYLEQAQPDHCPVCEHTIPDIKKLLERLSSQTPTDVAQLRKELDALRLELTTKQTQALELETQENLLVRLEADIAKFPHDLQAQISGKQNECDRLTQEISALQVEISQIEGKIRQASESRKRLQDVVNNIKKVFDKAVERDWPTELECEAAEVRQRSSNLSIFDFQPISDRLDLGKKLFAIQEEQNRLNHQLATVLSEVKRALGPISDKDIPECFENSINLLNAQIAEIQSLDFQPIASNLARAQQLQQIQDEEARLSQQLGMVQTEVRKALSLHPEESNFGIALENAIMEIQERATRINDLDLKPVEEEIQRSERLEEILSDESKLHDLENNYQAANREKTRLKHQVKRLTELRDALQDIAETTKIHQSAIVTGVLNNLDIHYYYRQLDPHPAYTTLQIEPELTDKGTYNYWIKALTDDYSHGTYVQTRFSTAQANCAAIAIFLAVNQHLSKTLETILLDDPSQSMDPEYQQRLAKTLSDTPRQVIVATEDPQMYEYLTQSFDSPIIYKLSPWTIEGSKLLENV